TLSGEEVKSLLCGSIPPAFISPGKKIRLITDHSGDHAYLCPCLNLRDDTCRIYAQRPLECRLYPLVLARSGGKFYLGADSQCPFVEQEMLQPAFQEYIESVKAYLRGEEASGMLRGNLHLFQEYTGIVTLAELKLPANEVQQPLGGPP
ncbi:MAG: YkgJ family cysteine cluster protein, partial [Candidatus Omnitrophica bacterium]|nr:YkgJ family cysteine cluster protein [Candidatus Omnitrophota bacterium]